MHPAINPTFCVEIPPEHHHRVNEALVLPDVRVEDLDLSSDPITLRPDALRRAVVQPLPILSGWGLVSHASGIPESLFDDQAANNRENPDARFLRRANGPFAGFTLFNVFNPKAGSKEIDIRSDLSTKVQLILQAA